MRKTVWWNGPVSSFRTGIRADQRLVPGHAHTEVSDRDGDVRDCGKRVGHPPTPCVVAAQ